MSTARWDAHGFLQALEAGKTLVKDINTNFKISNLLIAIKLIKRALFNYETSAKR